MKAFNTGLAAIVFSSSLTLILAFTPWQETYTRPGAATVEEPAAHSPVFMPPEKQRATPSAGVRVDHTRLGLYLLLAISVSIAAGTTRPRR